MTNLLNPPGPLTGPGIRQKDIYLVEEIRAKKPNGRSWLFYVKWEGWGDQYNSWEPKSNIFDPALIKKFEAASKWTWQFAAKKDEDKFTDFDAGVVAELQKAYEVYLAKSDDQKNKTFEFTRSMTRPLDGSTSTYRYVIDFDKMTQSNTVNGTERLVRRIPSS